MTELKLAKTTATCNMVSTWLVSHFASDFRVTVSLLVKVMPQFDPSRKLEHPWHGSTAPKAGR